MNSGVANQAAALDKRETSACALAERALQLAKRSQPDLNAFITIAEASAMHAAEYADAQRGQNRATSLNGIPFAHKDIFCTQGIKTTCASKMLADFVPPYDATVHAKLREAGAICIGKANMDEFAMGSSNEQSFFGPVKNPWDRSRVPGGSSGGSAALVAAGVVPFATGSDTGGSIRQPASFCGITGLKPTYGRVSRHGMIAYASSLDQAGVLARTAEDCALVLRHLAGHDARDPTSADEAVAPFEAMLEHDLRGLRIGIVREYFGRGVAPAVAQAIMAALAIMEKKGARLEETSLPALAYSIPAYYALATAEASSNLARYDGVRYGHRAANPKNIKELYAKTRGEGFGLEVKRRILIGTYVLSSGYYEAYYRQAQQTRELIRADFARAFAQFDLLAGPTAPTTAFKLDEKTADPTAMYAADMNTVGVNLAGLPAISVPAGLVDGLPVGLQLVANAFEESVLLAAAHRFQQSTEWHALKPGTYYV